MEGCLVFRTWAGRVRPGAIWAAAFFAVIQTHRPERIRSGVRQSHAGVRGRQVLGTPRGTPAPSPLSGPSPAVQPSGHALGAGAPRMGTADAV